MDVVQHAADLVSSRGGSFVPTMGALHAGHAALIRHATTIARPVVLSIFVNPTQFGPNEDLARYPRQIEHDLALAAEAGCDVVFTPSVTEIYPPDEPVPVPTLPPVATEPGLEDAHRPGHFAGVAQVVARLFDLVRPGVAVFGEKDYQQLLVVRAMVAASGPRWPDLRIVGLETVREPDGLAMSSRNAYLDAAARRRALGLSRALAGAAAAGASGRDAATIESGMRTVLEEHRLDVEYAVVRDATTLRAPVSGRSMRALVAARLGAVRLIDNAAVSAAVRSVVRGSGG